MNKNIEMAKNVWVLELGEEDQSLNYTTLYNVIQSNRRTRNDWHIIDCSSSEEGIAKICDEFHRKHWNPKTGRYSP